MEASKLFIELRSRGINLIACEEDGVCKNIEFKINELENQALLNMMQTLHSNFKYYLLKSFHFKILVGILI